MQLTATFEPWNNPSLRPDQSQIISNIYHQFVISHFNNPCFDASHDLGHVQRVTTLATDILQSEQDLRDQNQPHLPKLDTNLVILSALLHDVMDRKYAEHVNPEGKELIVDQCVHFGVPIETAWLINNVIKAVSYSYEIKHPDAVAQMIAKVPEVAIVQDSDRLDAIGAIGVGRCFTYNGVHGARGLGQAIEHFDILLQRSRMVKTDTGKCLAAERGARLQQFLSWWKDEKGPGLN